MCCRLSQSDSRNPSPLRMWASHCVRTRVPTSTSSTAKLPFFFFFLFLDHSNCFFVLFRTQFQNKKPLHIKQQLDVTRSFRGQKPLQHPLFPPVIVCFVPRVLYPSLHHLLPLPSALRLGLKVFVAASPVRPSSKQRFLSSPPRLPSLFPPFIASHSYSRGNRPPLSGSVDLQRFS